MAEQAIILYISGDSRVDTLRVSTLEGLWTWVTFSEENHGLYVSG